MYLQSTTHAVLTFIHWFGTFFSGCGCGHFISNFLCAACDRHWEDHETFFETEDVRAANGLPVGMSSVSHFLSVKPTVTEVVTKHCSQIYFCSLYRTG